MSSPPSSDLDIAVVGLACRFPGADSLEEFWDILETGSVQCRDVPIDRFPEWRFERRRGAKNFKGNMINDVDAFDHKFFKVASHEAKFMDPQQRRALEVVYQALESADYFINDTSDKEQDMGCYFATCASEYHEENVASNPLSAFSLTGSIRPFIAGKVSHHFGWTGPAVMFDTACSGSATAIHHACRAIAYGDCTTAVAGATNLFISPDAFQELAAAQFISSTGASKSFDAAADGYCRGEGIAFVVLKKLSTALKDGNLIRGVISSTAIGQNTNETSIIIPHGPSQTRLYRKTLRLAGLEPKDISYVEGHGTGTAVGDPIELESIQNVFGNPSQSYHNTQTYLGSVKSNIGHTEGCSGIASLLKVLLMLQKQTIPQQALFERLNPAVAPMKPLNIEIPTKTIPWTSKLKNACVNNYGASGTNAVMIVTQLPSVISSLQLSPITTYPISISAFSLSSLTSYCSALLEFINKSVDEDMFKDVAYHLTRRNNLDLCYSVCAAVSSLQELKDVLRSTISKQPDTGRVKKRPLVLFFGGQTGNSVGISRTFYNSFAVFRKHLENCDAVLQELNIPSIFPVIFEPNPHDDLVVSHSILFCAQYASAMTWIDCGLQPARLLGHSFGQLTALCVSGVLSIRDALQLITSRANMIKQLWGKDTGFMIAIEADLDRITRLLSEHSDLNLEIACYNGPRDFVIAGGTASMGALQRILESSIEPFRWKRLQITHAFHSSLTEPLVKPLQDMIKCFSFHKAKIPVEACTIDQTWEAVTPELVAAHMREPVYFHQAVTRVFEQLGPCTWLVAGSTSGVAMLRRSLETLPSSYDIKSVNLDSASSSDLLAKVTSELWRQGNKVRFWPFHKTHQHQYRMLNLPPYQFDKAHHWLEYPKPIAQPTGAQLPNEQELALVKAIRVSQNGGEFLINTNHESWRTTCSEYQILGMSVCPNSLLLDIVFQAINTMPGTPVQTSDEYHISNWKMRGVITADSGTELKLTVITYNSLDSWEFVIGDASDLNLEYAAGSISLMSECIGKDFARFQRLVNVTDIKRVSNDVEADSVRGNTVYKILSGFSSIPKSRYTISQVSMKANEAVGYLQSSAGNPFVAIEDFIRVPLLCLNGLHDRRDDQIHIPTAVGQTHYRAPAGLVSAKDNTWAVYVKFFEFGGSETTCDIFVFDMLSEQLFATILDLSFICTQVEFLPRSSSAPFVIPQTVISDHKISRNAQAPAESLTMSTKNFDSSSHDRRSVELAGLPVLTDTLFDLFVRMADVPRDSLTIDATITDLGIDSLMAMEITEEINNCFSVNFSVEELAAPPDINSLCEVISKKATGFSYVPRAGSKTSSEDSGVSQSGTLMSKPGTSSTMSSLENEEFALSRGTVSPSHSIDGSPAAVLRAFDSIREKFDEFAVAAGCDKLLSHIYPRQVELVVVYVMEAFMKLGCDLSSIQAGDMIPTVPHVSKYDKLIVRLMHALQHDGLVRQDASGWIRTSKKVSPGSSSAEKLARLVADYPDFALESQLVAMVGSVLHECLAGKVNPITLLFGTPEKRQMMTDQYTTAPMNRSATHQLVAFLKECFGSRTTRQALRVLEIGGGTCGTTMEVVEAFAQLNIPVEYTFSDISPSFVRAAKSKLQGYDFVKFRSLDIMAEPTADLVGYFDMIHATNVIHATPDTCGSASNARRMLRPGGFITFTEYTQPLYTADLVYGQLDGWWLFEDGREHAMMGKDGWNRTLKQAGFHHVDWTEGKTKESQLMRIFLAL